MQLYQFERTTIGSLLNFFDAFFFPLYYNNIESWKEYLFLCASMDYTYLY